MVWDFLNSLLRVAVTVVLVYKLVRFFPLFNPFERAGMGFAASASLFTITVIWQGARSPYDGWGSTWFTFGILIYFLGRLERHWRHERNNWLMTRGRER